MIKKFSQSIREYFKGLLILWFLIILAGGVAGTLIIGIGIVAEYTKDRYEEYQDSREEPKKPFDADKAQIAIDNGNVG